ncbi:MAG: hypothetical protein NWE90_06085 [Candidatus Bathyarchaeota archaeon]|nr:hypothetical protein [Candidatus Bathyarchaeota archaeon]
MHACWTDPFALAVVPHAGSIINGVELYPNPLPNEYGDYVEEVVTPYDGSYNLTFSGGYLIRTPQIRFQVQVRYTSYESNGSALISVSLYLKS